MAIPYYDAGQVESLLDYPGCIDAMRAAMRALSIGDVDQPLRQIVQLGGGRAFGVMPGDLSALETFGAKLVSVFPEPAQPGRSRHRGVVVMFDRGGGEPLCLADAEAITTIRTACATAAATDALANPDADVLALFGTGTQARSHLRALLPMRPFRKIWLWGRSEDRARDMAAELSREHGVAIEGTADGRKAAGEASVICTVSSSADPILLRQWVREGTHVNLVGSSHLGPVEIDAPLVAAARYFADYRPSALAQASELAVARDAGLVDDSHVVGEIGEVLAGRVVGREDAAQITLYKSLGHVVQDLAATAYVHDRARRQGKAV